MSQWIQAKVAESHIVNVKAKSGPEIILFDLLSEVAFVLAFGKFELPMLRYWTITLKKSEFQGSPQRKQKFCQCWE